MYEKCLKMTPSEFIETFNSNKNNSDINLNLVDWKKISMCFDLTEDFILKFSDRLIWSLIYKYQKLSINLIENGPYVIDKLTYITKFQKLTEDFIIKNISELNINLVWICQIYSENLLLKLFEVVNWDIVSYTIKITNSKLLPYVNRNHNWLYLDYDLRLNLISKYYTVISDDANIKYVECYKSVRSDYSSIYAPHIKYNKLNEFYETVCDFNYNNYISFGFGGWTYIDAKNFAHSKKITNYKILKIHIPIESCCLISNFSFDKETMNININYTMLKRPSYQHNPKIRCNKFKIVSVENLKKIICKKSRFLS